MARYIDADKLLEQVKSLEQLARKRVYDTPTNSPAYERYATQYQEREKMLAILKAQPTADVAPKSEVDRLEYTLLGVMHSVDKWLDGDELKQDEVNRAATMREKTLRIIENANTEVAREIFADIDNMLADFVSLFHDNISKATIEQNKDKQQVNSVALSVINTTRTCFAELKKKYDVTDTNVGNKCAEGDK